MPARRTAIVLVLTLVCGLLAGCSSDPGQSFNRLPEDPATRAHTHCRSNVPGHPGYEPSASPTSAEDALTARDVAAAERVAMPEDHFWRLIGTMHGSVSDPAVRRLRRALETGPEVDLVPFEARLDLSLYALDDECRVDWYDAHDPTGLGNLMDDDFLYVRTDTIAAGRTVWEDAMAHDTLPWGTVDAADEEGEDLLYVAGEAAHHDGVRDSIFERSTQFDDLYETGTNPDGWSPTAT